VEKFLEKMAEGFWRYVNSLGFWKAMTLLVVVIFSIAFAAAMMNRLMP